MTAILPKKGLLFFVKYSTIDSVLSKTSHSGTITALFCRNNTEFDLNIPFV